jgi:hypothetical protein
MTTFLCVSVGISLALILLALLMERSAILARINGGNGMAILAALFAVLGGLWRGHRRPGRGNGRRGLRRMKAWSNSAARRAR